MIDIIVGKRYIFVPYDGLDDNAHSIMEYFVTSYNKETCNYGYISNKKDDCGIFHKDSIMANCSYIATNINKVLYL